MGTRIVFLFTVFALVLQSACFCHQSRLGSLESQLASSNCCAQTKDVKGCQSKEGQDGCCCEDDLTKLIPFPSTSTIETLRPFANARAFVFSSSLDQGKSHFAFDKTSFLDFPAHLFLKNTIVLRL